MTIQHTKSSCCQAIIKRYGGRRRQCSKCLRTWRIYQKKQGRKTNIVNTRLLERIMVDKQTIRQQHKLYYQNFCSLDTLYKRCGKIIKKIINQPLLYPEPSNNYILLIDGAWFRFKKQYWIIYLLIIKPMDNNKATVLDPVILPGQENYNNWIQVIDTIPMAIKKRIKALVSDNFNSSGKIANHYGWVHQLCNFHLLMEIHRRRGRRNTTLKAIPTREAIYQNVRQLLKVTDKIHLNQIINILNELASREDCPYKLKMIVRTALRKKDRYRSYLLYPKLNLPNTNNAVESAVKKIKDVTRKLNSPRAVQSWAIAFIRLNPTIICNGKKE